MLTTRNLMRAAIPVLTALTLTGCGMLSSSGTTDKYEVNDPDRTAARVVANVVATTLFIDAEPTTNGVFTALLFDADGRQFYGPEVLFQGEKVEPKATDTNTATRYVKTPVPYAAGNTFTVAVQGNTATTPPALPAMRITAPTRSVIPTPTQEDPNKTTTVNYFEQVGGQPVTLSWSGGDPSRPVYIVILGDPTSQSGANQRRLYVRDNLAQSPTDPENYGLAIPNTGSFTIPAEITERVVAADGSTTTRTIPTFGNPTTGGDANRPRLYFIYVVQRTDVVKNGPLEVSAVSIATAVAGVKPTTPQ